MGLKIPTLRRFLKDGQVADGVLGVVPTITWPSHTSIITGVRPDQHGVLSNARIGAPLGESYWSVKVLKARTLYQCAADRGLTTATITWPTTVDAKVTYNLPEYFFRRNGGSMDLEAVASQATPGLVAAITQDDPSFPQQWVDDRTRTVATLHLLRRRQPDLVLLHLVDLDLDQHDRGPFGSEAKATLERTDQLIGEMERAARAHGYRLAIVSDHGFERLDRMVNLKGRAAKEGVKGPLAAMGGVASTNDPAVADWLRKLAKDPASGVGREIPAAEWARFQPNLPPPLVAFEPAEHVMFGGATDGPLEGPPREKGEHGFWPGRPDYRSVFVLYGPGIGARRLGEVDMLALKDQLAKALDLDCPAQR